MKITIDGPAGSGKSYIAKAVSVKLGIPYLETGLAYRAVGYMLLKMREALEDVSWERIKPLLEDVEIIPDVGKTIVLLNGEEIKEELLRSEEVGRAASVVGTVPRFREYINDLFREIIGNRQAVVEGRDAGTHIFPDAELKLFVTASPEERAQRRWRQLQERGVNVKLEDVLKKILERDRRDAEREEYPFRPAADAVVIDTTGMDPEESVETVMRIIKSVEDEVST